MVDRKGLEPFSPTCKAGIIPRILTALSLVPPAGNAPATDAYQAAVILFN